MIATRRRRLYIAGAAFTVVGIIITLVLTLGDLNSAGSIASIIALALSIVPVARWAVSGERQSPPSQPPSVTIDQSSDGEDATARMGYSGHVDEPPRNATLPRAWAGLADPPSLRRDRASQLTGIGLIAGVVIMLALVALPVRWVYDSQTHDDGGIAIVAGAHANAPIPHMPDDLLPILLDAIEREHNYTLVVNSGRPRTVETVRLHANNEPVQRVLARQIQMAVAEVKAEEPESDLLNAVDLGARALAERTGPRLLVIIDSGLSTAPPLRFQDQGVLSEHPETIVEFLEATGELPDLSGIEVVFVGIGDTAPPQLPLGISQRENLKEIWKAIAERAGAQSVRMVGTPMPQTVHDSLPAVTLVPVPEIAFTLEDARQQPIVLPEEAIPFLPDSTELRDPGLARELLARFAEELKDSDMGVTLTGTSASGGTAEQRIALSLARAEAIQDVLVSLGVPPSKITIDGVGVEFAEFVEDRDEEGNLIPGKASLNRNVIVELN